MRGMFGIAMVAIDFLAFCACSVLFVVGLSLGIAAIQWVTLCLSFFVMGTGYAYLSVYLIARRG